MRPLGPDDPQDVAGYRLLARIGEGGMGSVYLSRTRGNQPVALKVIRREYAQDEEFRRRFEQEATSARRVQGYHIVPVVDHDTTGPQPWLATVYVPGLALDRVLALHGTLPLPTVLQLTGCAAEALHAVHKAGVIHRDMKPSNILIGSDGPWIIDFGIARAADATQLTRSGGLIGTPQFMSPEHANGQEQTPAADVFSLGLIAAVAATGRHPYGDSGAITLATKIANTEFRPPDLTSYPEPLRTVLERTLAADPAARPSPSELAALCEELAERPLRDFTGWLPEPVAADIARQEQLAGEQGALEGAGNPASTSAETGVPAGSGDSAGAAGATTVPPGSGSRGTVPPNSPSPGGYTPTHTPASDQPTQHAPTRPPQPASGPAPSFPSGAPPTSPPSVTAPAPAPARSRTPLVVGAAALAVVVVGAAAWVFTRDDDKDTGAKGGAGRTASSGPTGTTASPSTSSTAGGYTVVFKDKPLTLRAQFTTGRSSYTNVDLDSPQIDTHASSSTTGAELQYAEWGTTHTLNLVTTTGKSAGPTPEQCAEGAAANALPSQLAGTDQGKELTKGTLLCTVTDEKNLAMLKITDVVLQKDSSGYTARDYVTELTLWKTA
ncbi:protein kinase domain-containing protein [Streptomyces sp. NBC_00989]|uniref:serine/threonine-protein kinase n=1 Tax=Streptomyces sp. NBC_00989 TaxID=2903705 RepID=UPI0038654859|nr:protein kinase [Streptomyces sp. NBC_00989]